MTYEQWAVILGLLLGIVGLLAQLFGWRVHINNRHLIRRFLTWWQLRGTNNDAIMKPLADGIARMTEIDGHILRVEQNTRTRPFTHEMGSKINGARPIDMVSIGADVTGLVFGVATIDAKAKPVSNGGNVIVYSGSPV